MKSTKIILLITFLIASLCSCGGDSGNGVIAGVSYNAIHFGPNDFESMPSEVKGQIAEHLKRGVYTTEGRVNDIIPEGVGSWREDPNTILERLHHTELTMFAVLTETGEILLWKNDSEQITGFNFDFDGFKTIVEIAEWYLAQGNAQEMTHKTWPGYGPPGTNWEKRAIVFRDDDLLNFQSGPDIETMAEAISKGFLTDMGEVYQSLTSEENLVSLFEAGKGEEFILWTNGGACEQGVVWNVTFYISDGADFSNLFPDVKYYIRFLNPDDAVALENYIETCGCGSPENFQATPAWECP